MAKSTVKFKETVAEYERLAGEVRARRFAPVYLLMGEESYFIDALCDLLAGTVLQESERAFSQYTVYGRDVEAGQVVNLCRQLPMMGERQVVILKEAQQMRQIEKARLLHRQALADHRAGDLPQGEERRQALDPLQGILKQGPCSNRSARATTR